MPNNRGTEIRPLVCCAAVAIALTAAAAWLSVSLAQEYYAVAPYHYDSAAYRRIALWAHDTLASQGLGEALSQSLQAKDSLDVSLRLLFGPGFLLHRFGHLAVLLPFMAMWAFLVMWYIFRRTGSLSLGCAGVMFLLTFRFIYNPHGGIADYWKDNLATWLLSGATVAWLLAEGLTRSRWSFFSGLLLGLLTMQRSAAGVYAAMLFLPLITWATHQRVRTGGLRHAVGKLVTFFAPGALLAAVVITLQWRRLYAYYFVTGYSYGTPSAVLQYLVAVCPYAVGPALPVLLTVYLVCALCLTNWRRQRDAVVVAAWMALGLPLAVMFTSALYFGFFPLWAVLLVVLLATLVSGCQSRVSTPLIASAMLAVALACSVASYAKSRNEARSVAQSAAPTRTLYQELVAIIGAGVPPHRYGLLFSEVDAPFVNYAFFDHDLRFEKASAFVSIHDSYYQAAFPGLDADSIAHVNLRSLESHEGTIVVGYCRMDDVGRGGFDVLARKVAILMSDHVLRSPHWKAIRQLDSPFGCLYAYEYSERLLTDTEKWQGLRFLKSVAGIPLLLSLRGR